MPPSHNPPQEPNVWVGLTLFPERRELTTRWHKQGAFAGFGCLEIDVKYCDILHSSGLPQAKGERNELFKDRSHGALCRGVQWPSVLAF